MHVLNRATSLPLNQETTRLRFGTQAERPDGPKPDNVVPLDAKVSGNDTFQATEPQECKNPQLTLKTDELVNAIANNDSKFFDQLFDSYSTKKHPNVAQFDNDHPDRKMKLTCVKGDGDKRLVWFDFEGTGDSPLLNKLAKRFTFAKIIKDNAENSHIAYEVPHIDKDNAQLTAYCMKLDADTNEVAMQKLRIYAGENFFLTTHPEPRFSIAKGSSLLMETGKYKTPGEMLVFIMNDTIHRYGNAIESLSKDFKLMNEKIGKKQTDETVMKDFLRTGRKIDELHENVVRQKQVIDDLMELNQFHHSPFLNNQDLQNMIKDLDSHLERLDHYQDRKNGLIELQQTRVSNDMNDAMKRIASYGLMAVPSTAAGALWGMNVKVPGGDDPNMFMYILGGIAAATTAIFFRLKYRKWL